VSAKRGGLTTASSVIRGQQSLQSVTANGRVPTSKGSATVLINNLPAARWIADQAGCGVFLGDAKLAPLRTVLIGG
jgi:hypothetical protein